MKQSQPVVLSAAITALLLAGCAHEPAAVPVLADQVRVDVTDVAYDHSTGTHYLVLEEKSGRRVLPIAIGEDEARAIMFELRGIKPERPLTYELMLRIVEETGNKVDRVVIGDVRAEVYYAKVYLDHGRYTLDSRPSDAIALAIGADAPIFVADKLLQTATAENRIPPVNLAKGLGLTTQELTPELAQYFGVAARSGVLVADLGNDAQKAGVQRGDIVTQLDGKPITTPGEFTQSAEAAIKSGDSQVSLTIQRAQTIRVITLKTHSAATIH
ncbi:MAG TPA: bifunctional nuclease domain-containing protein [Candidatus Binataceae bacterium]|nr:bifunctional nuclease domain-containing protein [Candidatus Binataceae bacterium]